MCLDTHSNFCFGQLFVSVQVDVPISIPSKEMHVLYTSQH